MPYNPDLPEDQLSPQQLAWRKRRNQNRGRRDPRLHTAELLYDVTLNRRTPYRRNKMGKLLNHEARVKRSEEMKMQRAAEVGEMVRAVDEISEAVQVAATLQESGGAL